MTTKSLIDELTHTQPYVAGRCWFGKATKKDEPQLFCIKPARQYEISRRDEFHCRGASPKIKLYACDTHVKRLQEKYEVTLVRSTN